LLNQQKLAIDSIANPHLNDDPGAIITFPGETFGLIKKKPGMRSQRKAGVSGLWRFQMLVFHTGCKDPGSKKLNASVNLLNTGR
jgi:hypothetical protein